jgi:aryl-alcohol dehydrogenase-like predicted oxidoreductase
MTSDGVTEASSQATLQAAFEAGINFFDTAYCYGAAGESETLIARALGSRRREIVIATKGGIEWSAEGKQIVDGRPQTLRRHCETSLKRLATDHVELLYLHAPDPKTPIEESAAELARLKAEGKTRTVGLSNATLRELQAFAAVCPLDAYQPRYNLLQRDIEQDRLPWCQENGVSVMAYWPLLKGLFSGKLTRDHVFDARDGRRKYPMFQGEEWQKNLDFVDDLRAIAADLGRTMTEVVVNWTIHQPGITVALCGAKRPEQIEESARAMGWELDPNARTRIEAAVVRRGPIVSRAPV